MKCALIASVVLVFAVATSGSAQQQTGSTSATSHYTRAQLKQLVHNAHSQEQYEALTKYYRGQQNVYLGEAAQEKQEWIRRSQNVMAVAAKYPRPVDSARYLYEYYADQARRAGQSAEQYQQLAVTAAPAVPN